MKIDYEKLGFRNSEEFALYHFKKFDPETQEELKLMGVCPNISNGGEKEKNKESSKFN